MCLHCMVGKQSDECVGIMNQAKKWYRSLKAKFMSTVYTSTPPRHTK